MDDLFERAMRSIDRYLEENADGTTPVVQYMDAKSLQEETDLSIGQQGVPAGELLAFIEDYLRYSVRTGHRQFHNQLYGGFSMAGFLGDVVTSVTNTSMYTYEVAPLATLMELKLIDKMSCLVGFTGGEGIFCSGGSHANLIGMLCARNRVFSDAKSKGLSGSARLALFVSEQAHYSFLKSANQLGIGTDNVIEVKANEHGRMIARELHQAIERSRDRGRRPFFVGATSGTTVLGAFDPLPEIAEVCARHGLWLHVDGSWGAPILLSDRHRHLLAGSELADSFTWDAHKLMGATLTCTAFLTKHEGVLRQTCSAGPTEPEYLFHDNDDSALDLGRISLQCGRRVDSFKLWLMWKHHGDGGFAQRIDHLFELADFATRWVQNHHRLDLMTLTQSLNVCFRYLPEDGSDPNAFNLRLREEMHRSGRNLVNYCRLGDDLAIRLVFANPDLHEADVVEFFETLTGFARQLSRAATPAGAI